MSFAMPPLSEYEQSIIRDKGTERPHTGIYVDHNEQGVYVCRQCGTALYRSAAKFDAHCGRPSFDDALPGRVAMVPDADGMRTEITCRTCGGHLGHIFVGERQTDKNARHCVNSVSMVFVPADELTQEIPVYPSIVLGGGCFWCVAAALERVPGVIEARCGYMGGKRPYPMYEHICTGVSGHHEVVRVWRDDSQVSLEQLLDYFFAIHDPTSRDRQGNDVGSQYRSVIFYEQKEHVTIAQKTIASLQSSYDQPIVTEVKPVEHFWIAEGYHQSYFAYNGHTPYCQMVVAPKVDKINNMLKKG